MRLADRQLRHLPDAFGRIQGVCVLDVSRNQLEVIPDAIGGLDHLEELRVSANALEDQSSTDKSDDLVKVLRELTVVQRNIANLQVELQGRKMLTSISTVDDLNYPEKTETYYVVNVLDRQSIRLMMLTIASPLIIKDSRDTLTGCW